MILRCLPHFITLACLFSLTGLSGGIRPLAPTDIPYDPLYPAQWYLPRIGAPTAWDVSVGRRDIIVAVIDTGVDYNHPDLAANMWPGLGYDFVDNDSNPYPGGSNDAWHGTAVAGIIGAAANTTTPEGIAGLNWHISIMALRVMAGPGADLWPCPVFDRMAQAVRFAYEHGAKVINISIGKQNPLPCTAGLDQALWDAYSRGVIVVAAVGQNLDGGADYLAYPASHPAVMAVGATDEYDRWPAWSNYGDGLDLVAPGVKIATTIPLEYGVRYVLRTGTSYAAPQVAGAAALLMAAQPWLTPGQVRGLLESSADQVGRYDYSQGGWNPKMGHGRLNIGRAARTHTTPPTCLHKSRGDANCDGRVDGLDMDDLHWTMWQTIRQEIWTYSNPDFDGDGEVSIKDRIILFEALGAEPNLPDTNAYGLTCALKYMGDADCDGRVTDLDLQYWMERSYHDPGNLPWYVNADFNGDNVVGVKDGQIVYRTLNGPFRGLTRGFGAHWSYLPLVVRNP